MFINDLSPSSWNTLESTSSDANDVDYTMSD